MCAQAIIRPSKSPRAALSRQMRYSPKFGRDFARYTRFDEVLIGSRKGLLHACNGGRSAVSMSASSVANGGRFMTHVFERLRAASEAQAAPRGGSDFGRGDRFEHAMTRGVC